MWSTRDQIVDELGADAFRMYEMFMGAFDQAIPWSTEGARGCRRFLDRVWRLMEMLVDSDKVSSDMAYDVNFTIKKVSEDYERMKYNTAIAQMMSLVNAFYAKGQVTRGELRILCLLLNPVSPHITEEINELCGPRAGTVPLAVAQVRRKGARQGDGGDRRADQRQGARPAGDPRRPHPRGRGGLLRRKCGRAEAAGRQGRAQAHLPCRGGW